MKKLANYVSEYNEKNDNKKKKVPAVMLQNKAKECRKLQQELQQVNSYVISIIRFILEAI